ncbi:Ribokinase-like protein [Cylindrobasidium torrendii FP15055 ss-10]|uniref:pyridoxal kinase n=1 Tax=Cylindrobasidium torrendii FP15055 ss-10 TaxID=1314674 RepID=A0A0D7BNI6_9AGAR|nr:Ribokinase-like protein [Cylindrobasidium torrendii FP15055 ss-10]
MSERVLSIQSHVAFGYVGGKAAIFPLQCLGYDVDAINTVNFSNHAGYRRSGGTKTNAEELKAMFDAMEANELLRPSRLLTGYIPGAEALSAVHNQAVKLKHHNPDLIYVLDPVMGDAGRIYVAEDVIPVYRKMLPLATVITPNWFEVETLTETPLVNMGALRSAISTLHKEYQVPNVVVSSIPLYPWLLAALPSAIADLVGKSGEHLLCIASSYDSQDISVYAGCVPTIPGYFSGVGDLFSALLLGFYNSPSLHIPAGATPLASAVSQALTKTHAVLCKTHEYSETLPEIERLATDDEKDAEDPMRRIRRMRGRELRLVQSQDIIRGTKAVAPRDMVKWQNFI